MKKMDKKKTIISIMKFIIVFGLFYYSSYIQYIPIKLFNLDINNGAVDVVLSTFSNIVLAVVFILIYKKELISDWKIFKKNFLESIDVGIKAWFIGLIFMFISNAILIYFNAGKATNEQLVQEMISALPWVMLIDAGIIGPFIEEIIFRKAIKDVFENKYIFIIVSGLFFGLMHVVTSFNSLGTFLFFIPYSVLGAAFAYAYQKTNTIFTSTAIHMIHNTTLILISILPTLLK